MKQRYEKTKQQILKILPYKMRMYFERNVDFEKLQEIRIRINRPVLLKENGKEKKVVADQKIYEASAADMKEYNRSLAESAACKEGNSISRVRCLI